MTLRRAFVIILFVCSALVPAETLAQQLVFVVRHAERADGGSMSATAETDPKLSPAGEARARRLAEMLGAAGVKAIYVTEYKRTQDTAKPLAEVLKVTPAVIAGGTASTIAARAKAEHPRDVVLVVGHSNTIPAVVKALGGADVKVADDDYGSIFVVVPATGTVTTIKY